MNTLSLDPFYYRDLLPSSRNKWLPKKYTKAVPDGWELPITSVEDNQLYPYSDAFKDGDKNNETCLALLK